MELRQGRAGERGGQEGRALVEWSLQGAWLVPVLGGPRQGDKDSGGAYLRAEA